jgi:hypothetical protein
MKKLILFVYLASIAGFYGYSQMSLTLSNEGGPIANNSYVYIYGSPTIDEIISDAFVTNTTNHAIQVKVKKVEVSLLPGTVNVFCWGLCFAPGVNVSPDPLTINAGATNTADFSGHYTPNGAVGVSTIRYVFFDMNNTSDTVCFNVVYDTYPEGVENSVSARETFSNAFPNPAGNVVNVDYTLGNGSVGTLVIRNILGSVVKEMTLSASSGRAAFNTADLADGIYFYSGMVNGEVKVTRKLVVKH